MAGTATQTAARSWTAPAPADAIKRALEALKSNGMDARLAANGSEARKMVLDLIPAGAEVFTLTSITLDTLDITRELDDSGEYNSVRAALNRMDSQTQKQEMRKLCMAPHYAVGSAHAVTESGTVMIASLTGSQLGQEAYGAGTLIWVIGAQKIVKDVDEGMRRIREHLVDLESERARKAYGLGPEFRTAPNKILLFNREVEPGRVKVIIVNEALGF